MNEQNTAEPQAPRDETPPTPLRPNGNPYRWPAGLAPRVTADQVAAAIKREEFTLLPDGRTTVCTMTLDNDFTVRGESSCVCDENFDAEIGRGIARKNAEGEVWKLLGFRLADQLKAQGLLV